MTAFLPPLHPDELLYSLLARVHWFTCSESLKRSLDGLFASRNVRAGVAIQPHLARLCRNVPAGRHLTPKGLTRRATLFPYLTAFHPPEVKEWALSLLTEGNADAVQVRLGLVAGAVRMPTSFRYCPVCRDEMLQKLGELYWIRSHQLPGVMICPHHEVSLLDSMVAPSVTNQHEFIAADRNNCPPRSPQAQRQWGSNSAKLLLDIAKRSIEVLVNPPRPRSMQEWGDYYRSALIDRGFGKGASHLNQEALQEAYSSFFEPIFSILPAAVPERWLQAITRKHRKSFSPLRHILFELFLDATPESKPPHFHSQKKWPCINRLADHCGRLVMTKSGIHKEGGKTINVLRCTCGYAFSQSTEPGSRIRILDLGPIFELRLRELVATGTSLRGAAGVLAVDTKTVRRYASKFGLITKWRGLVVEPKSPAHDKDKMRLKWSSAHAALPGLSRKRLRLKIPAVYIWLYRHDRDWLMSQPPLPAPSHGGKPRKDWPEIDGCVAAEMKIAAANLRAQVPPVPVTRSALERLRGKPGWLESRLHKLPLCTATINEVTESTEAFQCRRIDWAADELRRIEKPVIAWRIRRLAGLPACCAPTVEAALIESERNAVWSSNR